MLEAVLHHHEELLQGGIVRVQRAAQVQRGLDQPLDAQLGHVHQVHALVSHEVIRVCNKGRKMLVTNKSWAYYRKHSTLLCLSLSFEGIFRAVSSTGGTLQAFCGEKSTSTRAKATMA